MSGGYAIRHELAGPIMTVLYQRKAEDLDTGSKMIARIFGWPETRIRAAKVAYRWKDAMQISISKLRRDGGTQARAEIPAETRLFYADLMRSGYKLPPITVFYDGTNYWVADGFIRLSAAEDVGLEEIDAAILQGTLRDAQLYSFSANIKHGHPPTIADKKRAAMALLNDPEGVWCNWSDREIARRCGIASHTTVAAYRNESQRPNWPSSTQEKRKFITKYGTEGQRSVSQQSQRQTSEPEVQCLENLADSPNESVTPVAEEIQEWAESEPETSQSTVVAMDERVVIPPSVPANTVIPKKPRAKRSDPNQDPRDQYLASCKVSGLISDECMDKFVHEYKCFRLVQAALNRFRKDSRVALNQYFPAQDPTAGQTNAGPFATRMIIIATTVEPNEWEPCRNCKNDALVSTGRVRGRTCTSCRGFGFLLNSPPKEVAADMQVVPINGVVT